MGTDHKNTTHFEKENYTWDDELMGLLCYNLLGNYGRLGNMMFQYASLLGIARDRGMIPVANISQDNSFKNNFELGSVGDTVVQNLDAIYQEQTFAYSSNYSQIDSKLNVEIRGYFQSPLYFNHRKVEVSENFKFSKEIRNKAAAKIPNDVCVSVHVRRGDYTKIQEYHHNQTVKYYEEALAHFRGYRPVFFSDDIEWCKQTFGHIEGAVFVENEDTLNLEATVSSDESAYVDMCAMSFCNAHIIANSSFSWWGAYLGEAPTVAPATWFGPKGPQDWHDIYCPEWTVLDA